MKQEAKWWEDKWAEGPYRVALQNEMKWQTIFWILVQITNIRKLTREPFKIDVDSLPVHIQKQAFDLKSDSEINAEFKMMIFIDVETFCLRYFPVYP